MKKFFKKFLKNILTFKNNSSMIITDKKNRKGETNETLLFKKVG